jgi:trehalose 6-phosphate phosphatase
MTGHTRWVTSALRSEALAPLRGDRAHAAILFDLDGTLAPIAAQPSEARVPQRTRQALIEIARDYGAVACVTGRQASEARAMVAIGTISYLGSHGAELLRAGWTEAVLDPQIAEWARRIHEFGDRFDTSELRRLRVRLEDKAAIVAFHWRGAPDEAAARAAVDRIAAEAEAAGLRTHWGRKVLEVRPPVQFDKGAAIASFLRDTDVQSALYVGDDVTDLDAFRALAELTSEGRLARVIRVGVRSDEGPQEITDEADVVVDGTDGVRELLELLVADEPR